MSGATPRKTTMMTRSQAPKSAQKETENESRTLMTKTIFVYVIFARTWCRNPINTYCTPGTAEGVSEFPLAEVVSESPLRGCRILPSLGGVRINNGMTHCRTEIHLPEGSNFDNFPSSFYLNRLLDIHISTRCRTPRTV